MVGGYNDASETQVLALEWLSWAYRAGPSRDMRSVKRESVVVMVRLGDDGAIFEGAAAAACEGYEADTTLE